MTKNIVINNITESVLSLIKENVSDIVYHFTDMSALKMILSTGKLYATFAAQRSNKGEHKKHFFISTQVTPYTCGYSIRMNVRIELDGSLLNNDFYGRHFNYWNFNSKGDINSEYEYEDRIYLNVPYIDIRKYVRRIDVLLEKDDSEDDVNLLKKLSYKNNIAIYFYKNKNAFNKRKTYNNPLDFDDNNINISQSLFYRNVFNVNFNIKKILMEYVPYALCIFNKCFDFRSIIDLQDTLTVDDIEYFLSKFGIDRSYAEEIYNNRFNCFHDILAFDKYSSRSMCEDELMHLTKHLQGNMQKLKGIYKLVTYVFDKLHANFAEEIKPNFRKILYNNEHGIDDKGYKKVLRNKRDNYDDWYYDKFQGTKITVRDDDYVIDNFIRYIETLCQVNALEYKKSKSVESFISYIKKEIKNKTVYELLEFYHDKIEPLINIDNVDDIHKEEIKDRIEKSDFTNYIPILVKQDN